MRNLKKLLALVLALVMTMSLVAIANASDYKDVDDDDEYATAIDVMSAIGVIDGVGNNNFDPDGTITREQAAKIVATMLLGSSADDLGTNTQIFSDVAAGRWSAGYIAYCANKGILSGVGGGKFDPAGILTGAQFGKMLLVALGYDPKYESYTGNEWAINVASDMLMSGVNVDGVVLSAPLPRAQAAQMAFNTLTADMVEYSGRIDATIGDNNITVSNPASKIEQKSGATNDYTTGSTLGDDYVQFCEQYFPDLKLNTSGTKGADDYGRPGGTWTNKGDDVVFVPDDIIATWTTGLEDITQGDLYKALGDVTSLDIYENGETNGSVTVAKGSSTKANFDKYKGATLYAVDTTSPRDGKADRLCVAYAYLAQVTKVTDATSSKDRSVTLKVWNKSNSTTNVTYETDDFAKDDYVMVYPNDKMSDSATSITAGKILDVVAAESVAGEISSIGGTNTTAVSSLTVNGTKYTAGGDGLALKGLADDKAVKTSTYGYDTPYTLYVSNGYVMGVDGEQASAKLENIVYATHQYYTIPNSYGVNHYWVKAVHLDGTVEMIDAGATSSNVAAVDAAGFYTATKVSSGYTFAKVTDLSSTGTIDNSSVYYGTTKVNADTDLKATTTTITPPSGNDQIKMTYIKSNTRLLYVSGSEDDVKVSVETERKASLTEDNALLLLSKDGNTYVVEAIVVQEEKVTGSEDVVYIDANATGETADGKTYDMYDLTTGEKTTVVCKEDNSPDAGFATYTVDADNTYKFKTFTPLTTGNDNKDGAYDVANGEVSTYNGTLSVDSGSKADIIGLSARNALILNLVSGNSDSLSLSDLASATTLTALAYVKDETVVAIVVTAYTAAV